MPPSGAIETTLAAIWSETLGIPAIGREDDFFALGGDERSSEWVIDKVRQLLGVNLSPAALFAARTLSEVAKAIRTRRRRMLAPIPLLSRSQPLEVSFSQERLLFLAELDGGKGDAYHVPLAFRLIGRLDELVLARSLDRLVERQEALRTTFGIKDGSVFQTIGSAESGFSLVRHDLVDDIKAETKLYAVMSDEAAAPFDLESGPLIRGRLIRLAADKHVLLVTMHHIISDGWSIAVFVKELGALYCAFYQGMADSIRPLPVQYADFAAWQRLWLSGEVLMEQRSYWREALSGVPTLLELPTDRRRPAKQEWGGAEIPLEVDEALTAELKARGRSYGMTLFMVLLAGWALVLSRLSGQEDLVIGTPTANRPRGEVEGIVGFFVNTLPLRMKLEGVETIEDLLTRTRNSVLGAQEHQDLPFEQVVELIRPPRSLAHTPIFQVMFAWQNNEPPSLELPELRVSALKFPSSIAKFDLTLELAEVEGRIVGGLNYATALFDEETARRYAGYFHQALNTICGSTG